MSLTISHPPTEFTLDPTIENDEELGKAVGELLYMRHAHEQFQAAIKLQIAELKKQAEAGCSVDVRDADEPVSVGEYAEKLHAAIESYSRKNRAKLLERGKKSRDFTHGTIGWQKKPARIDIAAGKTSADVVQLIKDSAPSLIKRLRGVLASLSFMGTRQIALVAEPDIKLSKSNAQNAYDAKQLSDKHLKKIGLKYFPGSEEFYVKPHKTPLKPEAA